MELIVDLLVSAVSVIVVGQYTWAGKGHFASDKMPRGALLIMAGVNIILCGGLYLLAIDPSRDAPIRAAEPDEIPPEGRVEDLAGAQIPVPEAIGGAAHGQRTVREPA